MMRARLRKQKKLRGLLVKQASNKDRLTQAEQNFIARHGNIIK